MNEPASFGTNDNDPWYFHNDDHPNIVSLKCPVTGKDSALDNPPYKTWAAYKVGGDLCSNTICMLGATNRGKSTIYEVKTMFGLFEVRLS
jgi:hypothetical protein